MDVGRESVRHREIEIIPLMIASMPSRNIPAWICNIQVIAFAKRLRARNYCLKTLKFW